MSTTGTPLNLTLPAAGTVGWDPTVNANFSVINAAIAALQAGGTTGAQGPAGAAGPVGLIYAGGWQSSTAYTPPDVVRYNGAVYIAIGNSTGATPDVNPSSWDLLVPAGAAGPQGPTGPQGPQGVAGGFNVSFPLILAQGGTGGTDAPSARAGIGAAASGDNRDITSMEGITDGTNGLTLSPGQIVVTNGVQSTQVLPTNLTTGQVQAGAVNVGNTIGDGTGVALAPTGITWGIVDGAHNGVQIGLGLAGGVGGSILCSTVGGGSSLDSTGLKTGYVTLTQGVFAQGGGTFLTLNSQASGTLPLIASTAGTHPQIGVQIVGGNNGNTPVSGEFLLGFTTYPTQTTVGAAGTAASLPTKPSLYLQLSVNGTLYVAPLYLQS